MLNNTCNNYIMLNIGLIKRALSMLTVIYFQAFTYTV